MADITQKQIELLQEKLRLQEEDSTQMQKAMAASMQARGALDGLLSAQRAYNTAVANGTEDLTRYEESLRHASAAAAAEKEINQSQLQILLKLDLARQKQQKQLEYLESRQRVLNDLVEKSSKAYNTLNSAVATFTGLNLDLSVGGIVKEFARLALETDSANASLVKATGYTQRYQKNVESAARSARRFGGSFTEGSEAIAGLNNNMTLFATLGRNQQNAIQDTSLALAAMGVDAAQTGQAMDLLTRGMNMSAAGALSAVRDFDILAQSVGLPTSQIVSDFVALGPELAKFGGRATKVFGKMQRQARRLGLDIKEAFNIEQQFETFEGASSVAGKLNAQMGLRLNSIKLMKAEEGERIDMMRQEFAERGLNFTQLNRWQRKATAEILGVDETAAQKIFGTPADLAKYQDELQTIEKRAAAMTDVTKLFKGAAEDLFIRFLPDIKAFAEKLREMAETLNMEVIRGWGRTFEKAMKVGAVVVGLLGLSMAAFDIKIGLAILNTRKLVAELLKAAVVANQIKVGAIAGPPTGTPYRLGSGQGGPIPPASTSTPATAARLGRGAMLARGLGGGLLVAGGSMAKDAIGGTAGHAVNYAASIGGGALAGSMFGPIGTALGAVAGLLKAGYEQYSDETAPMQSRPQMQDGLRDKDGNIVRAQRGDQFIPTAVGTNLVKSRSEEKKNMKDQALANAEALKPFFEAQRKSNEKVAGRPVVAKISAQAVTKAADAGLFSGQNAKYNMFNTA